VIPGAPRVIAELRSRGCGVVFLSNGTGVVHLSDKLLESREAYAAKLTGLGIPAKGEDVINASFALVRYLDRKMPGATLFVIGEPALVTELAAAGFGFSEDPEQIDAVIASFDPTFDYHKLNIGFQALRKGARFLATNTDPTCPVVEGELPDAGAVIGALEGCSGRQLELVVGKPSPLIVEMALERLGLTAEGCLMVGDRLETDMVMGRRAGMSTALVLTGVTQREDLSAAPVQPDYMLQSVAELLDVIA
jgi:arabinose operon protein AraL